jgi:hypothetical protein
MSLLHLTDKDLAIEWIKAKEDERAAIERRRAIEDHLAMRFEVPADLDGTKNVKQGGYTFKVVGRLTRKVDSDMLQELAAEHGLSDHLSSLFRWKPEIDMKTWRAADPSITGPLAGAITVQPGRPSFAITIDSE